MVKISPFQYLESSLAKLVIVQSFIITKKSDFRGTDVQFTHGSEKRMSTRSFVMAVYSPQMICPPNRTGFCPIGFPSFSFRAKLLRKNSNFWTFFEFKCLQNFTRDEVTRETPPIRKTNVQGSINDSRIWFKTTQLFVTVGKLGVKVQK